MDTMNDLLICAKAVGRTAPLITSPVTSDGEMRIPSYVLVVEKGRSVEYTPRTNDAQSRELELYLLDKGWLIWKTADKYTCHDNDGLEIRGDTLNEAIIRAVVAMEDTHE